MGVLSLMERTSIPAAASARIADSRPDPGPLTFTSTLRRPCSRAIFAAFDAACCAANGVPLRDPRNPSDPELFHDRTLPFISEIVTIVLLKDACTNANPCGTCLRSFFLKVFFLPFFSGAAPVPPAAAGFAINSLFALGHQLLARGERPKANSGFYVFAVAFFFCATVPLRGPFLVRAFVWVRCPRTGRLRR